MKGRSRPPERHERPVRTAGGPEVNVADPVRNSPPAERIAASNLPGPTLTGFGRLLRPASASMKLDALSSGGTCLVRNAYRKISGIRYAFSKPKNRPAPTLAPRARFRKHGWT